MTQPYITKSTVWGDAYKAKSLTRKSYLMKKQRIRQTFRYPFLDHMDTFAYKPRGQKEPTRESQTFIFAFPYRYDHFTNDQALKETLKELNLRFYKEECIFRGKDAYLLLVVSEDVVLDEILKIIHKNKKRYLPEVD